MLISSDENVGDTFHCCCENPPVGRISNGDRARLPGFWYSLDPAEDGFNGLDPVLRQAQLCLQYSAELRHHDFAQD